MEKGDPMDVCRDDSANPVQATACICNIADDSMPANAVYNPRHAAPMQFLPKKLSIDLEPCLLAYLLSRTSDTSAKASSTARELLHVLQELFCKHGVSLSLPVESSECLQSHCLSSTLVRQAANTSVHVSSRVQATRPRTNLQNLLNSLSRITSVDLQQMQSKLVIDALPSFETSAKEDRLKKRQKAAALPAVEIRQCLKFLDNMDAAQDVAMVRTNCAYWLLGRSYQEYEQKLRPDKRSADSEDTTGARRQTGKVLASLLKEPCVLDQLSGSTGVIEYPRQKAFVQRLQRARKYILLTTAFPVSVLLAAPQVCITKLDKLTLGDLSQLTDDKITVMQRSQYRLIKQCLEPLEGPVRAGLDNIYHSIG